MESQADANALAAALQPLEALQGRVFACFGNHDHEAPATVRNALSRIGARLLMDDAAEVDTEAGRVQILGIDYVWHNRAEHVARVCRAYPRSPHQLRIVLLHDPGCFRFVPDGLGDLTLSGHTHGGQVGFVSLGLRGTLLRVIMNAPDHGLWRHGSNLLYVHRGTGHYGFPLRIGVPAEESLVRIHFRQSGRVEPVAA
jgi:predicted MPP superfamily phosphohydrolase